MLKHNTDFELEKEYHDVWDKIRYKKVDEMSAYTKKIIAILEEHIDDKLLFHRDYETIQHLFKKMRMKDYFYTSNDAKQDSVRIFL